MVCEKSGLVSLKHVALDGTKIKANTSKHKAMSYGQMKETRVRLEKETKERFRRNKLLDKEEDLQFGSSALIIGGPNFRTISSSARDGWPKSKRQWRH